MFVIDIARQVCVCVCVGECDRNKIFMIRMLFFSLFDFSPFQCGSAEPNVILFELCRPLSIYAYWMLAYFIHIHNEQIFIYV